jgi:hypothetical protein
MNEPTTPEVLAGLTTTRETDQASRLAQLLLAAKYVGLFTFASSPLILVVAVVMSR